jgi:hypothetical protein
VLESKIGDIDGPVALTHVASLIALGDTLFLTQALDRRIQVLSTDGEPLAQWGRHGEGPGEYLFPTWIGYVDDRLLVLDGRRRRLTHLATDGTVLDTRPFPDHSSGGYDFYHPPFAGVEGRVILFGVPPRGIPDRWDRFPGIVFGPGGEILDSLDYRFGLRRIIVERADQGGFGTSHPVVDGAYMAISPGGSWFVIADNPSENANLSVLRYDVETGLRSTLELPLPRVRIPRAYADSVQAALFDRFDGVVERFGRRAVEEATRVPETIPATDALLVTDEGEVWFRVPNFGPGPDTWYVVSLEGTIRAEVEVPKGLELMAKQDSVLWAHHQDEYWVSYISRLRLEQSGN